MVVTFEEIKSAFGKRVTVTAAIPYVNGVKHLGNLTGSMLPADIFHRFLDMFGVNNIFICGTDDHGTPTEISAAEAGMPVGEYTQKYHRLQKEIYRKWNFDFTHFGQSSHGTNHEITKELFLSIYNNGFIKKGVVVMPYCGNCRRFLPDRYVFGTCPNCGYEGARGDQCEKCGRLLDPAELRSIRCNVCKKGDITFSEQEHLFLNLSILQDRLKEWLQGKEWPAATKNFAMGWLDEGLKPRCITRSIEWGIKVPLEGYENLVFYVWFDAPIAYIAITKQAFIEGKLKNWKSYWTDSDIYHFVGKDNVPFHTIFWPGMLIAARNDTTKDGHGNFLLPHRVQGYEYLNWNGQKFSTSKGIGLFSDKALEMYPADYWRFYLSGILPETKDSNFDWDEFQERINSELIANYGNLFHRVTHFVENNYGGELPYAPPGEAEEKLKWHLSRTVTEIEGHIINVRLREALRSALSLSSELNKYFQDKKPWEASDEERRRTLYTAANVLRSLSLMLWPFIPSSAEKALKFLGLERSGWEGIRDFSLKEGHKIKAGILFEKIDVSRLKGIKEQDDMISMVDGVIPFKEFQKVQLCTGTILNVREHPNADKLYVVEVDLGSEKRQILAGLRNVYTKEELQGRQVIVVKNLETKEMRGLKSDGMLLSAEDGTLLMPEKRTKNGSKIM
ncbi:MAG: methionine--tRNA ligase [Candidatus Aenigmarchaeota archaeon]|nr:methionine--tRNA ligase [Candidatus Aenigmarchaeota archaeon]